MTLQVISSIVYPVELTLFLVLYASCINVACTTTTTYVSSLMTQLLLMMLLLYSAHNTWISCIDHWFIWVEDTHRKENRMKMEHKNGKWLTCSKLALGSSLSNFVRSLEICWNIDDEKRTYQFDVLFDFSEIEFGKI